MEVNREHLNCYIFSFYHELGKGRTKAGCAYFLEAIEKVDRDKARELRQVLELVLDESVILDDFSRKARIKFEDIQEDVEYIAVINGNVRRIVIDGEASGKGWFAHDAEKSGSKFTLRTRDRIRCKAEIFDKAKEIRNASNT